VTTACLGLEKRIHTDVTNQMTSAGPINARPAIFFERPNVFITHQNGSQPINSTNAHRNKNAIRSLMSFLTGSAARASDPLAIQSSAMIAAAKIGQVGSKEEFPAGEVTRKPPPARYGVVKETPSVPQDSGAVFEPRAPDS